MQASVLICSHLSLISAESRLPIPVGKLSLTQGQKVNFGSEPIAERDI